MNTQPWSLRKEQLALIHLAKKETGLSEENYRALLEGAAGVSSSKELPNEQAFNAVIKAFETLGFKKKPATSRPKPTHFWRCTDSQRAKIEVLWKNVARNPSEESLRRYIARIIHVDHPAWIAKEDATKMIISLSALARQAGLDPEDARRPE